MPLALVAFGGNRGDLTDTFADAAEQLARAAGPLRAASRLFRTAPIGTNAGDAFLNAAVLVETALLPAQLLALLHEIEHRHGRVRDVFWGPRPLDLDLIQFDDQQLETPTLWVPHPAGWYRRFVLDPVCDVAAETIHPRWQRTWGELRSRLLPRPLPLVVAGGAPVIDDPAITMVDRIAAVEAAGLLVVAQHSTATANIPWIDATRWGHRLLAHLMDVIAAATDVPEPLPTPWTTAIRPD